MDTEDRKDFEEQNPYAGYYGTGVPKRSRHHAGGWAILLIVLVLLLSAGLLLAQTYTIRLGSNGHGIALFVEKKGTQTEQPADLTPPDETAAAETAAAETQKPQKTAVGTGAELQISRRKADSTETTATETGTAGTALTLQDIYKKSIPSVVSIVTTTKTGTASGTGIVMTADGYLITNNHVIENGVSYQVMTSDSAQYDATLVGADSVSDLAVLKIDAAGLTAAEFGDSDAAVVGDTVVAIGDPLGIQLRGTMTDGIISAINRDLSVNGRTLTLLQTNAQLNNGNSGGPLINQYGQVIGINTMKLGSSLTSVSVEGLGFAIPIATAKPIIDELIAKGYVSGRPAIGIQGESVPAYAQAYYRLPNGVYVSYVYQNSDAYAKGIQQGDIITAIDGTAVASMDDLNTVKNNHVAGDSVTLTIYRSGGYVDVTITLMDKNDAD